MAQFRFPRRDAISQGEIYSFFKLEWQSLNKSADFFSGSEIVIRLEWITKPMYSIHWDGSKIGSIYLL